ncbi:MAG TPA: hypothetical protein VH540_02305 [Ktedonobacterales bacterium]
MHYLQSFSLPTRRQRLALMLVLCGAGSVGLYALLTLRYSLEQHVLLPLATLGTLSHYAPNSALFYAFSILLLLAFYLCAYWTVRLSAQSSDGLSERSLQIIIVFPIVAMLILLHLYPLTSLASINQAIQARVLTTHHANPYLVPAARFPDDPFTSYDDAQNLPATAGPLWLLLSAIPALLAGNNLLALVLLEKMLPILFALGCQRLVWVIATRVAPHRRWQALLLFSWNPLLLLETAGNGHNDIALLFFVLLACYFLLVGPRSLVLPALALALLMNMLALILLPFFLVALWRSATQPRQTLFSLGVGSGLALVLLLPLLLLFGGLSVVPVLFQPFTHYATSLPAFLDGLLQPLYGTTAADVLAKALAGGSFLVVAVALLERFIRHTSPRRRYEQSFAEVFRTTLFEGIFWFFVLGAVSFTPWMTLWLMPFAALSTSSPWPWLRANTLALSSLLVPLILIFVLNAALTTGALDDFTIQALAILSLFVPVLLVCGLELFFYRKKLLSTLAAREAELRRLHEQLGLSSADASAASSDLAQPANIAHHLETGAEKPLEPGQ